MKTATRKTSPRAFRIVRENGYIVRIIDKNYATVEGGRLPHRVGGGEYHLTTLDPRRLQVGGDEYHLTTLDPRRLPRPWKPIPTPTVETISYPRPWKRAPTPTVETIDHANRNR